MATRIASLLIVMSLGACASAPPVNGDWNVTLVAPEGQTAFAMSVVVVGENATATAGPHTFNGTFRDGSLKLKGDYYVAEAGYSAILDMDVRMEEERLSGSATWDQYSADVRGTRPE
ncbi:MAG: hypothetical protein OEV41_10810 [Gammaproteobacteria bacterium]|nr:hypothetical protein [Gammaproteobacteria bacterium]MDH5344520.1 hypothetical protein [Gammaproteobacteria bacterium]MDH5622696.1 hypothetical protein [Gammaproteobacteria bacterium]